MVEIILLLLSDFKGEENTHTSLFVMQTSMEIYFDKDAWGHRAQVYSPSRLPPATGDSLGDLATYGKTVAQGLTENLNPLYLQDIEKMKPCSGAVVQKGLEKVAVYVDENSNKHAFRAACPHLGCLVQVSDLLMLYLIAKTINITI